MSTTPAAFETKSILEAEKKTVVYSHTKDPRLMDIVNEGRARWETYREEGLFDELSLVTHDGLSLSGYYWPAGRNPGLNRSGGPNRFSSYPERTVVLLHALMDSASGMNYLAEAYHQLGWNVFHRTCALMVKAKENTGRWESGNPAISPVGCGYLWNGMHSKSSSFMVFPWEPQPDFFTAPGRKICMRR